MILYSFFMSSCAWRVRAALRAKDIKYEYRAVDLLKGEQRGEEYLRVNAMGQVPALVDGGLVLTQSMAALEYLEELRPEPRLLPADRERRAVVRQICEMINAGIQPVQSGAFARLDTVGGQGAGLAWGQEVIERGFAALEGVLAKTAGTCCVADQLTFADCCLVPQIFNAQRFHCRLDDVPQVMKVYDACMALPAFAQTAPGQCPDAA